MPESELEAVLTQARRFLEQQKRMYGSTMYLQQTLSDDPHPAAAPVRTAAPAPSVKTPTPVPAAAAPAPRRAAERPSGPKEPWQDASDLKQLNAKICNCLKCSLGKMRTKFVFGVGNPNADLMVIGEAPGADEDAQGEPFVGRAGQLLNKILEAVRFKREEVYIANILKCRPPENRKPHPDEVEQCEPYLWKQIELVKPKFILCLGLTAAQTLLKTDESLTSLRASVHNYHGVPTYVTYHPAALLRNPNWKRPTWEDVQRLRKAYDAALNT
ncbi:MAG: uracil-DNA glycosylase [Bacteroidetes bacterium]|nr:uracil-DNA glycosylase [Bacteroidota bacterium]